MSRPAAEIRRGEGGVAAEALPRPAIIDAAASAVDRVLHEARRRRADAVLVVEGPRHKIAVTIDKAEDPALIGVTADHAKEMPGIQRDRDEVGRGAGGADIMVDEGAGAARATAAHVADEGACR